MTGIKVDAENVAKQGLRGLGWLLSCRRPWSSFLECGPREFAVTEGNLCYAPGKGQWAYLLGRVKRNFICQSRCSALARPSAGEGSSQMRALY
jgi:hypothetical protein